MGEPIHEQQFAAIKKWQAERPVEKRSDRPQSPSNLVLQIPLEAASFRDAKRLCEESPVLRTPFCERGAGDGSNLRYGRIVDFQLLNGFSLHCSDPSVAMLGAPTRWAVLRIRPNPASILARDSSP